MVDHKDLDRRRLNIQSESELPVKGRLDRSQQVVILYPRPSAPATITA